MPLQVSTMESILVLLLSTPFLLHMAPQLSAETLVKVEPYVSSAPLGETFTVNITVVNVQNLYGVEVTLDWNESVLRVLNVEVQLGVESHPDGVLHDPIFIAENEINLEEGKYLLAGLSTAPAAPFDGGGNIVRITFKVISAGDSELDLETKLSDWPLPDRKPRISWPIEHATIDGFFDMKAPAIGIPTRNPKGDVQPEYSVKISVYVTDSGIGVKNVSLYYTVNNMSIWNEQIMDYNSSEGLYEATIPPQPAETWVKFKIVAYDYAENQQTRNGEEPYCAYFVIPEFPRTIAFILFTVFTIISIVLSDKILVEKKLTRQSG